MNHLCSSKSDDELGDTDNNEYKNLIVSCGEDKETKKTKAQNKPYTKKPFKSYQDHSSTSIALEDIHDPNTFLFGDASESKNQPFPVILHCILSNKENEKIISWLPHGRSWRVLEKKIFEEKVIPKYFRHARYSSFSKQVHGWGFCRVSQGIDMNSYYHELFLRGLPHLSFKMRRCTKKQIAGESVINKEPNFYNVSEAFPLPEYTQAEKSSIDNENISIGYNDISSIRLKNSNPSYTFFDNRYTMLQHKGHQGSKDPIVYDNQDSPPIHTRRISGFASSQSEDNNQQTLSRYYNFPRATTAIYYPSNMTRVIPFGQNMDISSICSLHSLVEPAGVYPVSIMGLCQYNPVTTNAFTTAPLSNRANVVLDVNRYNAYELTHLQNIGLHYPDRNQPLHNLPTSPNLNETRKTNKFLHKSPSN